MGPYSLLNGFSSLNCKYLSSHRCLSGWAETDAHFITLHAFLMSPILNQWHRNFRTTGFTPARNAHRNIISKSLSQLKD
ncbi:protein YnhH [Yokenella regensburgei]|uniref:protein YnhH n=1 Tax=Yokenella regensburgei TaxID=158877 RepID=UPI003F5CEA5F